MSGEARLAALLFMLVGIVVGFGIGVLSTEDTKVVVQTRTVTVPCTHGESSAFATIGKDGKIHQSKPVKTGCTP